MPFSLDKITSYLTTRNVIIAFTLLGFIVFGNMLLNGFVWDDKTFIILNPEVHNPVLPFLFGRNMFNDLVYYRPIPAIYFSILYSFSPKNVFIWHFLQLSLHILNTFLLYKLFRHFFKNITSFLLSLIFLVHPMQVESVSYIAQTVSPLFFLFGISSLLIFMRKNLTIIAISTASFLLLLSLLTKETGVVFVALIILYIILYRKNNKTRIVLGVSSSVILYCIARFGIGQIFFTKSTLDATIARVSFQERLLTIPQVIFYYIKTFVYPAALGVDQHWVVTFPSITSFYIPLFMDFLLGIGMLLLGIYCLKRQKIYLNTYLFFGFLFLGALFFHSQIVPLDMTVADRWFYLTLAGLLGLIGLTFELFLFQKKFIKITLAVYIVLILTFSIRTIVRNTNWVNAITLYTHDRKVDDNFDMENALAWEYMQIGEYDVAQKHIQKSIAYWPSWDKNWYNLGVIQHFEGKIPEAKKSYETALFYNPENSQVIENLSYLLLFYEDPKSAKRLLIPAVSKYPNRPKLWLYLGLAHYRLGDKKQAIIEIEKAYALDPTNTTISQIYTSLQNNLPIKFK